MIEYIDSVVTKTNIDESYSQVEILDLLSILNEREFKVIYAIYFGGISVSEIANEFKISRQAVNKIKLISLKKLRRKIN